MKKKLLTAGLIGLIGLTGCSTKEQPNIKQIKCSIDGTKAPSWVCNNIDDNKKNGFIYGVGFAEKSPLGIGFQRKEAIANARDEIARKIAVKIKNMLKKYYSSTGTGNSQTAERVVTDVSKHLAYAAVKNSRLKTMWISPKERVVVLVAIPKKDAKNALLDNLKTTFHNNQALWQEFKAQKAQDELEKEIKKEFN